MKKKSVDEEKVLRRITNLLCVVKKMGAIRRSGKGQRWRISQQVAELWDARMGGMKSMNQLVRNGKFGLTQQDEERRKEERQGQPQHVGGKAS